MVRTHQDLEALQGDGASDGALPAGGVSEDLAETALKWYLPGPELKSWAGERASRLASVYRHRSWAQSPDGPRQERRRAIASLMSADPRSVGRSPAVEEFRRTTLVPC